MELFICIKLLLIIDVICRCTAQSIFWNPQEGKAFLNRDKRDVNDCISDSYCEHNLAYCRENWEVAREDNCKTSSPCPGTSMCHLKWPCISPWHPITTECRNVNECLSYPCLNYGVCIDIFDGYNCTCSDRFKGINCEKDCRPGPADIVFVVDTSASVTSDNNRSIEFIDEFIRKVPIGPDNFQIGVITYNFVPEVLFDLNDYTSESDMLVDLLTIKTQEAATFTAPALQKAAEMLNSNSTGGRPGADKYIIILYDGLSSDRNDAVTTAASIIAMNIRILTVGFGNSISHKEMLMLSIRQYDTFSLPHIDHLIKRMFKETAAAECTDCSLQTGTDILILLDTSKHQTTDGYNDRLITTRKIIESILSYNPTARIGMMSYSDELEEVFTLSWSNDKDKLIAAALQINKDSLNSGANTSHALEHIRKSNLFSSQRKIILLLSDGNWNDTDQIKHEIELLDQEGVEVTGALSGDDCVISSYSDVIKDTSLLYYVEDGDWTALESLASTTTYYECIDDIFTKRQ